ncbi:MAG: primosomal protein N' [Acidobacteria bacterium]|nr:MAG: primosomal protein N' [Acidobacteriota bacterium]PYY23618.1 MAG: primosomal protein N' [Acidobacteriota bacterium]
MPDFCDVALPVPLEMTFTYRVNGQTPVIGGRVLVPFRTSRLPGVVTALHDRPPSVEAKALHSVLDAEPLIDPPLMQLAEWISNYYIAPIGEVLRAMLPLQAEVKRDWAYSITEVGRTALYDSAQGGNSGRSKKSIVDQMLEYQVLDYLSQIDSARENALRSAAGATRETLRGLQAKRWMIREDITSIRDAHRIVKIAHLVPSEQGSSTRKLNPNQEILLARLASSGGSTAVDELNGLDVPRTTLGTLVRRGFVRIEEKPAEFHITTVPASSAHFAREHLNPSQTSALDAIEASVGERRFSVTLLHGVTGSGKTAVYLTAMQSVLAQGRSAILLVPEIGLTPAAAANLHRIFGEQVAILHSGLTNDERAEQWHRIHRGDARIVFGTRSAVFAPVRDLALVVVDEEHDSSYKQEETPRYNARDVAIMRGKLSGAAVVLASATPALETYHNARQGRYKLIELRERVQQRPLPEVEIIDMRQEFQETGEEKFFSRKLVEEVRGRLEAREQAMILLNRRGYSAVVLCRSCGETLQCINCAVSLTHHKGAISHALLPHRVPAGQRLECHYCGYRTAVPKICPKCSSEHVYFLGAGSEKIEEALQEAFPSARIGRLDRDTVRTRHDFERVLNQLHASELDLLVGTQMIAKGHDIHGVTLVGVVGADFALGLPDFRAAERTFQLLTQVAGRAGRGESPGKVVLQTYFPEHYAIRYSAQHDYLGFYEQELRYRKWMHYPPFTSVANVLLRSDKLEHAMRYAGIVHRWVERTRMEGVRVMGPAAAPLSRLKRDYRYHFILKSASREKLNGTLRAMIASATTEQVPRTSIIVDVDPQSLM